MRSRAAGSAAWLSLGGAVAGSAVGSRRVMVSPPPGVVSGSRLPPMASASPRDRARPSPTPVALPRSPRRWNGRKTRSRSAVGMPGPWSMTRISTVPACSLAAIIGGWSGGLWRSALDSRMARMRSTRAGSSWISASASGTWMATLAADGPRSSAALATASAVLSGWGLVPRTLPAAGSCPAGSPPAARADRGTRRRWREVRRGRHRRSGALLVGITPPRRSASHEQIGEIAKVTTARLADLDLDGLILYDIDNETDRNPDDRPFQYLPTT